MAVLPAASLSINDQAGGFGGGSGFAGYLAIICPVATSADSTPRVFTSAQAILSQYGYCQGADYAAVHFNEAGTPVIFCGVPIVTSGVVGRQNSSGVTGTSAITVSTPASGPMEETQTSITVVTGGTVGTNGITFNLSCDGGRTLKLIRLGTNTSYTIPFLGITINFGAGSLVAGDVYSFTTTAPMWDNTVLPNAFVNFTAQQNLVRSFLICGDVATSTVAGYVTTQLDNYETAAHRYAYARVNITDRTPLAAMSTVKKVMSGSPSLTFAATGFTVTRSSGSWITDGFVTGDVVTFAGTTSNNFTGQATVTSATVLTFASGVVNEGPDNSVTCVGSNGLTFASAGHTITRTGGSWLADGFAVGDTPTVAGSTSNNGTLPAITALTATVMTFGSGVVSEGPERSDLVSITKGQTLSAWISAATTTFATVDGEKRIDLGAGRARKLSPLTSWLFRRPVAWAASVREYQHDVQIPCWRKSDGPLTGWDLTDGGGNVIEYDERTVGGALAARFTCFRTFGNGPLGAFVALSLTRATEGSLLSRTHNLAVANVACTIAEAETENAIGSVLVLNSDGTATTDSLRKIESRVNTQLQNNLLQIGREGVPRASSAVWAANTNDILNVTGATLNGTLTLLINGTLEQINTSVLIQTH